MHRKSSSAAIAAGLLCSVFLWGASNTATRYVVQVWPPIFAGCARFLPAGILYCALLRWTRFFGPTTVISKEMSRQLWWRGGLSLTAYILAFNWALKLCSVAHVTLYLGASPVWALLWEGRPKWDWASLRRFAPAGLALGGVILLLWPALRGSEGSLLGESLGVACSVLWTLFGRQIRWLGRDMGGSQVAAETFWRVGLLLAPVGVWQVCAHGLVWNGSLAGAQLVCVLGGSVAAFTFWNGALRLWPTSRVFLFNNLVPLSSMAWAYFCLGEQVTATFWRAMILIAAGVLLGQANWQSLVGRLWTPSE